ncbi:ATP-binding protein [Archangium lipolyticum]|uniref:ATP-binding protein n=1 Tax=Archangium lipolyticum TaxID=2970465 RepID=UPI00214A0764|nr:ATP-binding protein [Archangium lipolyticum]
MKNHGAVADVLAGGGMMGELMRALDWSRTPVGPVEGWPQSLRTSVSILLNSRFPMMIHWGPELTQFYNDAYVPSLGSKHPGALGQAAQPWWAEIWDVLEPMFERVLAGEATWYENQLFLPNRKGFIEEAYFTLSHSPIRDETGGVGGIFLAVHETTGRVVGERRLRALKELSEAASGQPTAEAACREAVRVLEGHRYDIPFALLYLTDAREGQLRRVATLGVEETSPAAPERVSLSEGEDAECPWPLGAIARTGEVHTLTDVPARAGHLSGGPWPEVPHTALVLPVGREGEETAAGVLVVGVSPRRALDAEYQNFLTLVAAQVATAIASARRAEEERRRTEALAELDRAKTEFFTHVSHELRTPLTLMLGPLEDALGDTAHTLPDAQRERVELAHRGAQRLLKLVNALLDFSRVSAGRMHTTFELTDLSALTAGLASSFEALMKRAGLRLVVDCPPLPEAVWVDREAWEKIVLNLVSNAFKFTSTGEVRVSLRWLGGTVELMVADTGTGIPEEELPRVFERFHRVSGAQGRSFEGSGIGLALVEELVKLHGGGVRVESAVGQGSTFFVSLPTGNTHLARERLGPARTKAPTTARAAAFVEEAEGWLDDGSGPTSRAGTHPAPMRGHVLLAEDNADMRNHVRRLLEEGGYTVQAVADGRAALEATRARPPDVVLSDVMMPGLDGFGLLRELKADARTASVPVILLSARAGEEATVEGLGAGASDYLVKPFSARELLARVEGTVKTARARADLDAFAGRIAHDLRNLLSPLTMIGAQVRATSDERAKRAGERLERVTRRAYNLLDGMLAFSLAGGAVKSSGGTTSVPAVAADVVEDLSGLREQIQAELDIIGVEDVNVALPRGLLYVVLLNLVSNALKFMEGRPVRRVELTTQTSGDQCALVVKDTGPGIAPGALRNIFEPFYRAPDAKASGHGIGLATVQRIVKVYGGEVAVSSVVGQGSTFTVRLPCRPTSRV